MINVFIFNPLYAEDEFKFNITEIDIKENGELILGSKGGKAVTQDGFEIIENNKMRVVINKKGGAITSVIPVSYTHLRAHETG